MLVARHAVDRDELVVEAAGRGRRRPALLRAQRERVLVLTRDRPALRDVLAGLAHRLQREHRLEARVRKAPAELRVPFGAVAVLGPRVCTRCAGHALDTTCDEAVAVAREHGVTGADD